MANCLGVMRRGSGMLDGLKKWQYIKNDSPISIALFSFKKTATMGWFLILCIITALRIEFFCCLAKNQGGEDC